VWLDLVSGGMQEEHTRAISDTVWRVLDGLHLRLAETREDADAVLTVRLGGVGLSGTYLLGTRCYSGAWVNGEISLKRAGRATDVFPVHGRTEPPEVIDVTECAKKPEQAPFEAVWPEALVHGLARFWGPHALVAALGDATPEVRLAAAQWLRFEHGAPPEAMPALVANLETYGSYGHEVIAVARALEAITLVAVESGKEGWITWWEGAAPLAGALDDEEEGLARLVDALASDDEATRRLAAFLLGHGGGEAERVVPALAAALEAETGTTMRRALVRALGNLGPAARETVPLLVQALQEDDALPVRGEAVWALGQMGPEPEVVSALVAALDDELPGLRVQAAGALAAVGPGSMGAAGALVEALADEDVLVRGAAGEAVPKVGVDAGDAVPALVVLLSDDEPYCRETAAYALAAYGRLAAPATEVLAGLLFDDGETWDVQQAAADALVAMGTETIEGIDLNPGESASRWRVARSYVRLGVDALPALSDLVATGGPEVQTMAAMALADLGPVAVDAVPVLVGFLEGEEDDSRRVYPIMALESVTGESFGDCVVCWQDWWDEQQR
jgi:HEAT repeat protein